MSGNYVKRGQREQMLCSKVHVALGGRRGFLLLGHVYEARSLAVGLLNGHSGNPGKQASKQARTAFLSL